MQRLSAIKDCGARITWKERFEESDRPLFLIANEFFDALPVRQFVQTERGWCERMVVVDEGGLAFALSPVASAVAVEGVANHLRNFWEARMRREIVDYVAKGGVELSPLAREAVVFIATESVSDSEEVGEG